MKACLFGWRGVTLADCVFYKVGSLLDVQLFHNISAVMFHGADAYVRIPGHPGHPFRLIPDTDSGASRTPIPEHSGH